MARGVLTIGWLTWGTLILLGMVVLASSPLFGEDTRAAWEWLIPHVLPMMALVGGVQVAQAGQNARPAAAGGFTPSVIGAIFFSFLYLALLSYSLLNALASAEPLQSLKMLDLVLGGLLTILTGTMAAIYVRS